MMYRIRRNAVRVIYSMLLKDNVTCAKKLGVKIGERCRILDEPGAVFGSEPWLITIGNHVEITNGVRFLTHEGALWCVRELVPELEKADLFKPIVIGSNVMIGMNSLIMPGVTIGDNVIVGAHSVVTTSIPSNTVAAGVPAGAISTIDEIVNKMKKNDEIISTKDFSQDKKLEKLRAIHPEWFKETEGHRRAKEPGGQ